MADISAFSNASFDPSSWVNSVLKNKPDEEGLESYLAGLAMKIHVVAQDYTDQLENGMVDAITSMPRVAAEVGRMEEALRNVDTELLYLTNQLASFDDKNATAVEELSRLDTLKLNIETCKGTLEEHARWNQMVREAWLLLENGGRLSDAADRVETMIKSLDVLKNVPGHAERSQECSSVVSSLFSALQPKIRSDVAAMNVSALKEYIYVYEKLGRSEELEEEYIQTRPQELKGVWESYKSGEDFAQWLTDYFGSLQSFLVEENKVMCQLFGHAKAPAILTKLLLELGAPMANELSNRLEDGVKRNHAHGNATALITYHEAEKFAAAACKILGSGGYVSFKSITETLLSIVSGFIQFSEHFIESNDSQLRTDLNKLVDDNIYFDMSQNDSLFDDAFEDELKPKTPVLAAGKPDGRRVIQSLDADNLDELVELLERFAEKILHVSDHTFRHMGDAIQNSCEFVKGIRVKPAIKLTTSSMKRHFKAMLRKISDFRIATGLNPIDGDWEEQNGRASSGRGAKNTDTQGRVPASTTIQIGSGGDSQDNFSGGMMSTSSEIALGVAKHYGLVGQEHTSAAKLLLPPALKCLQAVGRLFLCFIEFEEKSGHQLQGVLEALFQNMSFADYLSRTASSAANASAATANGNAVGAMLMSTLLEGDLQGFSELKGFLIHAVDAVAKNRTAQFGDGSAVSMASYAEQSASSLVIFSGANSSLQQLRFSAGSLLLDLCTMAPEAILKDYSGWDDSFGQDNEDQETDAAGDSNYDNILPQTVVTQVGEHLLSLVNEIETFSSSDAIYDLVPLLGTASELRSVSKCWRPLLPTSDSKENAKPPTDMLCQRASCGAILTHWQKAVATEGPGSDSVYLEEALEEDRSLQFVNEWLMAVTDYVVGLFLVQVVKLENLSAKGCFQLSADIGYLINVASALGIPPHPLLLHFRDIFSEGKASAAALLKKSFKNISGSNAVLRELHERMLRLINSD